MRSVLVLVVLAALAACGPKVKNQCAGTTAGNCVTQEQCSFDAKRGCQVCQCAPLNEADQDDPFRGGKNPDDRSQPPEPVH